LRGEGDRPGAGVGRVGVPLDQPAPLQQDEHRPHGARVGQHAAGELPLGEGVPAGEGGEEDELVGGDAVRREPGLRPAVEGQVRGAEGDREVASGGHGRPWRSSCVDARPAAYDGTGGGANEKNMSTGRAAPPGTGAQRPAAGPAVQTVAWKSLITSVRRTSLWVLAPNTPAYRSRAGSRNAGWPRGVSVLASPVVRFSTVSAYRPPARRRVIRRSVPVSRSPTLCGSES